MDDDQILAVIAAYLEPHGEASQDPRWLEDPAHLLAALRDAGYGIVRADELERLRVWKTEALAVLTEWDETWEALGRPGRLGQSKAVAVRELADAVKLGRAAKYELAAAGLEGCSVATLIKHHRANAQVVGAADTMATDTYRLGKAVQRRRVLPAEGDEWVRGNNDALNAIYAEAGVERP